MPQPTSQNETVFYPVRIILMFLLFCIFFLLLPLITKAAGTGETEDTATEEIQSEENVHPSFHIVIYYPEGQVLADYDYFDLTLHESSSDIAITLSIRMTSYIEAESYYGLESGTYYVDSIAYTGPDPWIEEEGYACYGSIVVSDSGYFYFKIAIGDADIASITSEYYLATYQEGYLDKAATQTDADEGNTNGTGSETSDEGLSSSASDTGENGTYIVEYYTDAEEETDKTVDINPLPTLKIMLLHFCICGGICLIGCGIFYLLHKKGKL